jgi:exo-poly-alpha-galacturonosidase
MKRKIYYLILILSIVSFVQAQKTDVWDFGCAQLDATLFNNKLDAATINGWYSGVAAGTSAINFPTNATITSGVLTWTGTGDRLRTTNTALTRYDANVASVTAYTGRLYANGTVTITNGLATSRYLTMTLAEDDEVTIIARCDTGTGALTFALASNYLAQNDTYPTTSSSGSTSEVKFVAKTAGTYRIFDAAQKASFYRIYRKAATLTTISGIIDETLAPGISGYSVAFTNSAGKIWTAVVNSGAYNVTLPAGYTYQMSLINANGFIISNGNSISVLNTTTNYNITVQKLNSFTLNGTITGLGTDVTKATLVFTPDVSANKIYVPKPVIDFNNSTYSVNLEPNTNYTISALGVNDYQISSNTITISGTTTSDIVFTPKTVYPVTINTTGLDANQLSNLKLTFTNLNESGSVYAFNSVSSIALRNGIYSISYTGLDPAVVQMKLTSNLKVIDAAATKTLDFVAPAPTSSIPFASVITVGIDKEYPTINDALAAIARMSTRNSQRVTVSIDPGNYEEMLDITQSNVTLKNAATTPSINLLNKGVDIDAGAVRITSYYGVGYNYYSMKNNQKWDADVLRVNKENGYQSYTNVSGTTNNSYWNATLLVSANGFIAEDLIIENSYNQYISLKESQDVVVLVSGNKGVRSTIYKSTAVQDKSFVERAAAIAVKNNIDKVILNQCRVVGRQDSFFGGTNARVVVYKGVVMGATDYIFGGMNAVFYKTNFAMNTSDASSDVSYITAAQQASGRGFLMYECNITSATPNLETASTMRSKPGYFGRPWAANTSEVVFYNTTIETTDYTGSVGKSLIVPLGWNNTLNGESSKMYEYGSIEKSGIDSSISRATWATTLVPVTLPTLPTLTDATPITTFNFTKGSDLWDPIPQLIANDVSLSSKSFQHEAVAVAVAFGNNVRVSNVKSNTIISVFGLNGSLFQSFKTNSDINFNLPAGIWIVTLKDNQGQKNTKIITY